MDKSIETIQGELNGLKYNINAYYEHDPIDVDFETEAETTEYIRRFDTGELLNLCIQVTIFDKSGNLEGFDSLGACHINSNDCLNDIQEVIKDHGMIEQALEDLETKFKAIEL